MTKMKQNVIQKKKKINNKLQIDEYYFSENSNRISEGKIPTLG